MSKRKKHHKPIEVLAPQPIKVGIEPPPDHIFKYRKNRQAPAQDLWGRTVSYAPQRAEYIEGKGNFVYYWGLDIPSKTVAPIEAINAVNGVKRLAINTFRILATKEGKSLLIIPLIRGKKWRGRLLNNLCVNFNHIGDTMLLPYYLEDGYYCGLAKELRIFSRTLLVGLGVEFSVADRSAEILGMMFEYDNAYRWRVQDMLTESDIDDLIDDLPRELNRLLAIEESREMIAINDVTDKFRAGVNLIKYAWWLPSMRREMVKALKAINLENCKLEKEDIYHTLLYGDYNVQGKKIEERMEILKSIHGEDMTKWPPRIEIRSK